MLTYHDALVERTDLGIEVWLLKLGSQSCKRPNDFFSCSLMSSMFAYMRLSICDKRLEGGILIEHQETVADVGVGNGAKLQHLLYQCSGFYRIVGIHLLKGREITGGKVSALQTVVALHR